MKRGLLVRAGDEAGAVRVLEGGGPDLVKRTTDALTRKNICPFRCHSLELFVLLSLVAFSFPPAHPISGGIYIMYEGSRR